MKLTDAHIEELYEFTRKHHVQHFDLQTELVDHLANGIQEQWKTEPSLSFKEALQIEFQKFGVFGFSDIIRKHDSVLTKKYHKLLYQFALEYFKLPKIIGTITAIIGLCYWQQFQHFKGWILLFLFLMFIPYIILASIQLKRQYKRKVKQTKRRWKLEEMIFNTWNGLSIVQLFLFAIFNTGLYELDNIYAQLLTAILIVSSLILTYIIFIIIPDKAAQLLRKTYPEYELLA
jgi:hypothetical protein